MTTTMVRSNGYGRKIVCSNTDSKIIADFFLLGYARSEGEYIWYILDDGIQS